MQGLQEFLHKLEEGEGAAVLKSGMAILLLLVVGIIYDLRVARNFATEEAMDTAQLARNISNGKGFTTHYVRPFDLYILGKHREGDVRLDQHPDLYHPPLYPVLLAGLMKALPFKYDIPSMQAQQFGKYQPEALITFFNQALFLLNGFILFRLARRWFDARVAWFSAVAFFGTELLWRFTTGAVGTQLSILLLLAGAWCLMRFEEERSAEIPGEKKLLLWAGSAGLVFGLLFLNRYALGILVIPAALFFLFGGKIRMGAFGLCAAAFLITIAPWVVRNFAVSGTPLGVAGYAIIADAGYFEGDKLYRTMDAAHGLTQTSFRDVTRKFVSNARNLLADSNSGAKWLGGLFLAGLLVPFKRPGLNRLKYFISSAWLFLFVMQALTRTHLSREGDGVNSENLLVLITPFIIIYAVSFYLLIFDQLVLPFQQLRAGVHALFLAVVSSGIWFQLLPPRNFPVVYPPYHPPLVQQISRLAGENELMISDIPWAVGWYGDRQALLLTLAGTLGTGGKPAPPPGKDFYTINDDIKPFCGMLLSPKFMGTGYSSILEDAGGWGRVVLQSLTMGEVPKGFPLRSSRGDLLPSHFVLFDWERWRGKKS